MEPVKKQVEHESTKEKEGTKKHGPGVGRIYTCAVQG
jgi:hypothetical protein